MELKIISPTENEFPQVISFNNEEIKKELTESLKKYEGLVYTKDNIKSAKLDRATLSKFKEAIETKRKEIKKQCLKPYEDFEVKVKEITGMVEKPILAIDKQVKAFEVRQKEEKKGEIIGYYNHNVGDIYELLPFDRIFNEKWLNATVSPKSIEAEIIETIAKVKNNLEVIAGLKSEFELQIKDIYLRGLDLSVALVEKTRLEEQKIKQEEYNRIRVEKIRAQEAAKKAAEEERKAQQAVAIECSENREITKESHESLEKAFAHEVAGEANPPVPEKPEIIQQDFRVWVTREQLAELKTFLLANQIQYGRVE